MARLSARAVSDNPPIRRQLVEEFCRAANWRNRKGDLCVASANMALNRLEEQGRVRLTAPRLCGNRSQARKLRDDDEELPALPRLSASTPISLQRIQDQRDPDHRLWNRLIIREHPLKDAPMVGSQLRYLIRSLEGVIGAFGVSPPACHLECRDTWIGWDFPTRRANPSQVIGLCRFLIRPGIRSPN